MSGAATTNNNGKDAPLLPMRTATARPGAGRAGLAASPCSTGAGAFELFDRDRDTGGGGGGSGADEAAKDGLEHASSSPASPVGNPGVCNRLRPYVPSPHLEGLVPTLRALIARLFCCGGMAEMRASCGDGAGSFTKPAVPRREACMSCVDCHQTPRSVRGRDVLECTSPRCNTLVSLPTVRDICAATSPPCSECVWHEQV